MKAWIAMINPSSTRWELSFAEGEADGFRERGLRSAWFQAIAIPSLWHASPLSIAGMITPSSRDTAFRFVVYSSRSMVVPGGET